jgi:ATP-dependent helicase/nuclease subunit A
MSKPILLDHPSRHRIVTDLTTSLLVEAGAGSGKTHEMARRMAAGIAAGVYQVEHMAAVTFTRKAAAELRGRFQAALEAEAQRLSELPNDLFVAEERRRVHEALGQIERLFSGTIHAFCARLLRERPIEAGVAPGFTELDDVEERLLRESSWREFRAQARAAGDPDLALLNEAGVKAKELDRAFAAVCNYEDVDFPADDVEAPEVESAWASLEAFWGVLQPMLPVPIDPETTCRVQQKSDQFQRGWAFARRGRRTGGRLAELLAVWDATPKVVQKWWSTDKKRAKDLSGAAEALHTEFRDGVVTPWLSQWRRHLYAPAVRLLTRAREQAQRDRQLRNTLSFNDLLMRTADVLRRNEGVRRALQEKFRWIFVDEFQDTDPLQAEIMDLLRSPQGALYVVGDPKQSIYRFRRADIDIYNRVRADIGGPDAANVVSLTTNFRSVPGLCEWANTVFASRFPEVADTYAPAFAPLTPYRGPEGGAPTLYSLVSDEPEDEARVVAEYIRAEVSAGRRSYGDFLLLTRKKGRDGGRLMPYVRALEALRVPIEVAGAGAFGQSAQVRELSQLLLALADPQDAVVLTGVLRGPLFGLSDPVLYSWRQAGGYLGLFAEGPAEHPVAKALAVLRGWHRYTRVLPVGAALERMLDESGYLALAATTPDGVEAGDLLHAIDRVRVAVEGGHSLAEAALALQDVAQESSEIESWPLEPGRPDVVRLMNLHKAKGLEAPVVFLLDPKGGYTPEPDIHIVRGDGAARGYLPIFRESDSSWARSLVAEPPDWEQHAAEEQRYLDAEEERLLYVAATRARDVLVVGRAVKPPRNAAWSGLGEALAGAAALSVVSVGDRRDEGRIDSAAVAGVAARAAAAHERTREATWFVNSVTEREKATAAIDPTIALTASSPARRADAGVAWGTLVHGLLEHAMRFPEATEADLRRLALWLTVEEPDLRPHIDQAVATVGHVSRAGFWTAARASAEVHEEAPFAVADRVGDQPGVLLGVLDLVYRDAAAGGWRIVDYKTDVSGAVTDLAARYSGQMRAYEEAWSALAGGPVTAELVSTRT